MNDDTMTRIDLKHKEGDGGGEGTQRFTLHNIEQACPRVWRPAGARGNRGLVACRIVYSYSSSCFLLLVIDEAIYSRGRTYLVHKSRCFLEGIWYVQVRYRYYTSIVHYSLSPGQEPQAHLRTAVCSRIY